MREEIIPMKLYITLRLEFFEEQRKCRNTLRSKGAIKEMKGMFANNLEEEYPYKQLDLAENRR